MPLPFFSSPRGRSSPAPIDLLSPTTAASSSSPRPHRVRSSSPLSSPTPHQCRKPTHLGIIGSTSYRQRNGTPEYELDTDEGSDEGESWPPGTYDARPPVQEPNSPNEFGVVNAMCRPGRHPALEALRSGPTARLVLKRGASTASAALPSMVGRPATQLHSAVSQAVEEDLSEQEEDVEKGELSRLRRELAQVKKQLQIYQENDTAPMEIIDYTRELDEIEELKKTRQRDQEFRDAVQNTLQCHVCYGLLSRPHALNPCGHVCCMSCLQDWFRSVDEAQSDEERPHEKLCPFCRAKIHSKPVELFIIKGLIAALALIDDSAKETLEGHDEDTSSYATGEDPWEGLFDDDDVPDLHPPSTSTASTPTHDFGDEDDFEPTPCDTCGSYAGVLDTGHCVACGDRLYPRTWLHMEEDEEDEDESDDDSDEEDLDEDEDEGSDGPHRRIVASAFTATLAPPSPGTQASHSSNEDDSASSSIEEEDQSEWIYPSWAPRVKPISRDLNDHLTEDEFVLCSRGVPYAMISKFEMSYTHSRGLCAKVHGAAGSVNGDGGDGEGEGEVGGMIWLGWNLSGLDPGDLDGSMFIARVLEDMLIHPRRYVVITSIGRTGSNSPGRGTYDGWKAWRLIREDGPEDVDYGRARYGGSGSE